MAEGEYQVVFRGELTGEHPAETVKQRLADLFGMPTGRIDALFSGKPVVVKKNVDRGTAERFEQTFRKAGAVCEIRAPDAAATADRPEEGRTGTGNGASASGPGAGPSDGSGPGSSARDAPATAEAAPAAGANEAAGGSTIAAGDPNGTVVAMDVPSSFEGLEIDDSDVPLAAGQGPAAPQIDTAGLSLAEDDATPLEPRQRPAPPEIDTSGLSMESLDDT